MANSRLQAIETAERLFRAQGYAATGLAQIITESGSPKGSFYFNFPGGKHELALEALKLYGDRVNSRILEAAASHGEDPIEFVRYICAKQAREMENSGWTLSCLAQQLSNELSPKEEAITVAVAQVIRGWVDSMATVLRRAVSSNQEATILATAFISGISGARTLSRVVRTTAPFVSVSDAMTQMLKNMLARAAVKLPARSRKKTAVRSRLTTH